VTVDGVLDRMIWYIDTLYTPLATTGSYSAISDLRTLQFTVTHALRFSVFTSRILATDLWVSLSLQITHEVFFAPPNSSLANILQQPNPKTRLSSVPLLSTSYPCTLASRNSTWLYAAPASFGTLLYNHFTRTAQKTQPLYCWEGVFTAPFHSNGSSSIITCVFVAAGMCLPSRCLARNVYSNFTIPALCHNIYVYLHKFCVRSRESDP
jgi:hypothetical protein